MTSTAEVAPAKALELTDIAQLGRVVKTKEILKGVKVTLQSLSATHQQKILAAIPPQSLDTLAKFTYTQAETLVYATVSINDKQYTDANRDELRKFYMDLQNKILQEFYSFYVDIAQEQNSVIESLKKTE